MDPALSSHFLELSAHLQADEKVYQGGRDYAIWGVDMGIVQGLTFQFLCGVNGSVK